jgi:carbon-monoxide dehydrogenase iron sulfur subunit
MFLTGKQHRSPPTLKEMLSIDMNLCTGCRNCELACSVRHTNSFNPARSRIQIIKEESKNIILPVVCLHCEVPLCEEACPTGAIMKNDAGNLTVNHDVCIGCYNCVTACVYGGVAIDPKTRKVVKCDMCNGDPACAKACEYNAIKIVQASDEGAAQRLLGIKPVAEIYGLNKDVS